jgi:hypothetical protein
MEQHQLERQELPFVDAQGAWLAFRALQSRDSICLAPRRKAQECVPLPCITPMPTSMFVVEQTRSTSHTMSAPIVALTFNPDSSRYGFTVRMKAHVPHYAMQSFLRLEDAKLWIDPWGERTWEEPSDADETKILVSRDAHGSLAKVRDWLESSAKSPSDNIMKERLKGLLAS